MDARWRRGLTGAAAMLMISAATAGSADAVTVVERSTVPLCANSYAVVADVGSDGTVRGYQFCGSHARSFEQAGDGSRPRIDAVLPQDLEPLAVTVVDGTEYTVFERAYEHPRLFLRIQAVGSSTFTDVPLHDNPRATDDIKASVAAHDGHWLVAWSSWTLNKSETASTDSLTAQTDATQATVLDKHRSNENSWISDPVASYSGDDAVVTWEHAHYGHVGTMWGGVPVVRRAVLGSTWTTSRVAGGTSLNDVAVHAGAIYTLTEGHRGGVGFYVTKDGERGAVTGQIGRYLDSDVGRLTVSGHHIYAALFSDRGLFIAESRWLNPRSRWTVQRVTRRFRDYTLVGRGIGAAAGQLVVVYDSKAPGQHRYKARILRLGS